MNMSRRDRARPIVVLLVVLIGSAVSGCGSWRSPTMRERGTILTVLQARLQADDAAVWDPEGIEIKVKPPRAKARLTTDRYRSEPASIPIRMELFRTESGWTVTSHERIRPWWWHVLHVVGLK